MDRADAAAELKAAWVAYKQAASAYDLEAWGRLRRAMAAYGRARGYYVRAVARRTEGSRLPALYVGDNPHAQAWRQTVGLDDLLRMIDEDVTDDAR